MNYGVGEDRAYAIFPAPNIGASPATFEFWVKNLEPDPDQTYATTRTLVTAREGDISFKIILIYYHSESQVSINLQIFDNSLCLYLQS